MATPTGVELIDMIHEKLLTSCELTGIWEKKLRDIEHKKYDAAIFIEELKKQISDIVNDVLCDNSNRRVTIMSDEDMKKTVKKKKATPKKKEKVENTPQATQEKEGKTTIIPSDELIGKICPECGKGHIIKGKNAYGCSNWKEGCKFVLPFE